MSDMAKPERSLQRKKKSSHEHFGGNPNGRSVKHKISVSWRGNYIKFTSWCAWSEMRTITHTNKVRTQSLDFVGKRERKRALV